MLLTIFYVVILHLASYGILAWLIIFGVVFAVSHFLRWPGVPLGHFFVALAVAFFDLRWITSEMNKTGWNGLPDQDAVFYLGILIRIALVNVALLPLNFLVIRRSSASAVA